MLDFLADVLGTRIDLATPGALRHEMREQILSGGDPCVLTTRRAANGFGPARRSQRNGRRALPGRDSRLRFRDWRFRVRDILDSVEAIDEYTDGMTFEEFCADRRTVDAVSAT